MEAKTVHTAEQAWEKLTGFPGEGEVQMLREEDRSRARTLLIRIHPGSGIHPHAHEAPVQHYILDGKYECEGSIYSAGTYRFLPKHANIAPIST
jgi:quercetin dioxygenase-like cupin family protein